MVPAAACKEVACAKREAAGSLGQHEESTDGICVSQQRLRRRPGGSDAHTDGARAVSDPYMSSILAEEHEGVHAVHTPSHHDA